MDIRLSITRIMWPVVLVVSLIPLIHGLADDRNFGHERVIETILQNYKEPQYYVRPAQNTSASVSLNLVYIKHFNKVNGQLTAGYYFKQSWDDSRLRWQDSSVHSIRLPADKLWRPDFRVYNGIHQTANIDTSVLPIVNRNGTVLFITPAEFTTVCKKTEQYGSWDCLLKIGSWTYNARQLPLSTYEGKGMDISVWDAEAYGFNVEVLESEVKLVTYDCCSEPYAHLEARFRLSVIEDGVASGVTSLVSSALTVLVTLVISRLL